MFKKEFTTSVRDTKHEMITACKFLTDAAVGSGVRSGGRIAAPDVRAFSFGFEIGGAGQMR